MNIPASPVCLLEYREFRFNLDLKGLGICHYNLGDEND